MEKETYKQEEVEKASLEYFKGDDLAAKVWATKYALKDSFGNTIKVKKGILPVFMLGSSRLSNVPVGFFAGNIGAQKMSVIGGEILKQFNLIFDIANHDLYIALRHA